MDTDESTVRAFLQRYEVEFPGVRGFISTIEGLGRQRLADTGELYVKSLNGRPLPAEPDRIYALTNYLIQGTCADLLKNKILQLDEAGLADRIVLPVHDEILLSLPEGPDGAAEAAEIHRILEDHTTFQVPLTCETTGPLTNWGEKYQ